MYDHMRPGTQFETEHFVDEHMRTLTDPACDKKKALQMIYCKMNQAYMFLQISLPPLSCSFVCRSPHIKRSSRLVNDSKEKVIYKAVSSAAGQGLTLRPLSPSFLREKPLCLFFQSPEEEGSLRGWLLLGAR